jgi:hypothetical protein
MKEGDPPSSSSFRKRLSFEIGKDEDEELLCRPPGKQGSSVFYSLVISESTSDFILLTTER